MTYSNKNNPGAGRRWGKYFSMSKEQALEHLSAVHGYALNTVGPTHAFTRDMAVWLQRQFGAQGTAAIQANARARTAQSKQAAAGQGGNPALTRFTHPKIKQAAAARGVAASLGESVAEQPAARPKKLQAAERPKAPEAQAQAEQVKSPTTENQKPVAGEQEAWAPLDAADLKDLKNLKARSIAARYPEGRIEATLRETYGVSDEDMPDKEIQKAAMLKAKLSE